MYLSLGNFETSVQTIFHLLFAVFILIWQSVRNLLNICTLSDKQQQRQQQQQQQRQH